MVKRSIAALAIVGLLTLGSTSAWRAQAGTNLQAAHVAAHTRLASRDVTPLIALPPITYSAVVQVPARANPFPGVDTGLNVTAAQFLYISASGGAYFGTNGDATCAVSQLTDPSGTVHTTSAPGVCPPFQPGASNADPNAGAGTLIGRIGTTGTPFFVGTLLSITAASSGELYLFYNDVPGSYGNNTGSFTARIVLH